ncbi:hypothetical protein L7F22_024131 [Adiantum nelumboides]|nr:hypothetical protein [Adiantum nelumboides]
MQMAMEDLDIARTKQTMEVLSGFLHNTKRTVEQLCEGHSLSSMQASKQRRTITNSAFGMIPMLDKGYSHDTMAHQVLNKPEQLQRWSFSSQSSNLNERISERRGDHSSEVTGLGFQRFPEAEMERAVGFFLNDMRKTVDTWCSRYRLLVEGKAPIEEMPQSMQLDMQVMNQLGFGPDADHHSVMADLDDRDNEVLLPYAQNRCLVAKPFVKKVTSGMRGVKRKPSNARANRKRPRAANCSSQAKNTSIAQSLDLSQQDMVVGQEPILSEGQLGCKKLDNNEHLKSTAPNNSETGGGKTEEGAIMKFGSLELDEKSAADVESPVQTDELTIRPHHYKVEVVESPDWLPKGWITELKTRSTGGSAGCRDKYYYDPVSKRRCRSQKEVFCFLQTGKLGRYKRKHQPANKMLDLDLEQQINSTSEMLAAEKEEAPGVRSTPQPYNQDSTSGTLEIFPGTVQRGWGGGTFLPYRPGQTADILYDSLTNLSRPGLDQYRYMDPSSSKSSADKSLNASRPWFLANAEFSRGALIDSIDVDTGIDRAVGQGFGRDRRGAPKRAKKSTKRAVS